MKIILYQPQIPQNTGNIVRTCAATGTNLILVRPLGFSTHSRHLKRAGLDYWESVQIEEIDDLGPLLETKIFYCFSSKANQLYTDASYDNHAALIFGSETSGLPDWLWQQYPERFFTIPMVKEKRCLNLACSVAIVLYEALRQNHFLNMEKKTERTTLISNEVANGR